MRQDDDVVFYLSFNTTSAGGTSKLNEQTRTATRHYGERASNRTKPQNNASEARSSGCCPTFPDPGSRFMHMTPPMQPPPPLQLPPPLPPPAYCRTDRPDRPRCIDVLSDPVTQRAPSRMTTKEEKQGVHKWFTSGSQGDQGEGEGEGEKKRRERGGRGRGREGEEGEAGDAFVNLCIGLARRAKFRVSGLGLKI